MKKMKAPKPRDTFVVHLLKRPSGAMGKSKKALRRQTKIDVKSLKDSGDL